MWRAEEHRQAFYRAAMSREPTHTMSYAVYICIEPGLEWRDHINVKKAVESQARWGGLHMSVTRFALAREDASMSESTGLQVHRGSLEDAVFDIKQYVTLNLKSGKWHPYNRKNFMVKKPYIYIHSETLKEFSNICTRSNLVRVTRPEKFHVTIGDADPETVMNMLLDPTTTYSVGVAVRQNPPDSVMRVEATRILYP